MYRKILAVLTCVLGITLRVQQAMSQVCETFNGRGNDGYCRVTGSCDTASQCIRHDCSIPMQCNCIVKSGKGCFFFGCNCNTLCPQDCNCG